MSDETLRAPQKSPMNLHKKNSTGKLLQWFVIKNQYLFENVYPENVPVDAYLIRTIKNKQKFNYDSSFVPLVNFLNKN